MNQSNGARRVGAICLVVLCPGLFCASAQARNDAQPAEPQAGQTNATKSAPSGQGAATKKAGTTPRSAYDRTLLRPAALKDKAPDTFKVKFTTTRGEFTMVVTRAWAPLGADRFFNLVRHHFYDNASVFRVVPGFVAQFGISSYPPVTAAWEKTEIKDDPVAQTNKKGYVTFATAGPNTRTTQVFINLKDNPFLDKSGFAPFGSIDADGMKVVEMFYDQYGDNAGIDQSRIEKEGKGYLDKSFPKLDTIKSAVITDPQPTTTGTAEPKLSSTTGKPATPTKKPQ